MIARTAAVKLAALALALLLAHSTVSSAQRRTDTVTLLNGDHITGEIMGLNRGSLEIKTDDAGTIDVEWDKVARLEARRGFEIETADGRRVFGSLEHAADAQSLQVATEESGVVLPMQQVTQIIPIGKSFWARLDGSISAGFSYSQSSGVAQATLNSTAVFRRPAFAVKFAGSGTATASEDSEGRDDRGALELSYIRYRGQRWFVSGSSRFDSNESLGLVLRSQIGAVVGQRLVNSNHAQFEAGGGFSVNDERAVDAENTQNFEGLLVLATSYYTYDRPKTQLDANVQYYPSLSHWGRQRLQIDTAIKREVWKDFYLSLNVYDSFDSAPPQPDSARNDVGVSFSIGWSY